MSTSPLTTLPPKTAPARRRRWPRVVAIVLAILVLPALGVYVYSELSMRNALADAEAEARLDLPRWRLMELEEDRPEIPDGENSALFMMSIVGKIGGVRLSGAPNYEDIFEKLPPNTEFNSQQERLIRGELARIEGPLAEARKLKDMPRGRYPVRISDDFFSTLIPNHQNTRQVAELLVHDGFLLAHDQEGDRAIESCQGILNAGRAFEGDPFMIAHLIRIAMQHRHVETLERVLAQTEPSEASLRDLQAMIEKEDRESSWLPSVRGERAGIDHLFENIQNGKVAPSQLRGVVNFAPTGNVSFVSAGLAAVYPRSLVKQYPGYLKHMNRTVEAAKLPFHESRLKLDELEMECKTTSNPLIRSLMPALQKVNAADARGHAMLRTAITAVACERYRQANNGAWPESLDALVKAKLMGAVMRDPFDNEPLRYRRTKEGVVIYSVGIDLKDDGGNIDHDKMNQPGVDIGFRLWNVGQRRAPPRPSVVIVEPRPGPGG